MSEQDAAQLRAKLVARKQAIEEQRTGDETPGEREATPGGAATPMSPPEAAPPDSASDEEDEMDSVVVDGQPRRRKRFVSYKLEEAVDLSSTDSFTSSLADIE